MTEDLEKRINSMFNGDKMAAWALVVGLWLSYAFVFFFVDSFNTDGTIKLVLMIGGGLVLLYNTASITAMISHYNEDRNDIYGIDIRHLDEMRAAKTNASNR